MSKFELEQLVILNGRINFYKLVINGSCLFDEWWNKMELAGNMENELDEIQAFIERKAQMLPTSKSKWKELSRPKKDKVKDFEIRTRNLRVYLFHHHETGQIIVFGGIKNASQQKQDIKRMRGIKKAYYNSL